MNPLIAQVTGSRLAEDVPVPCAAMPQRTYRDRLAALRKRRGEDEDGNVDMKAVLGEAKGPADVIPDDAEELDPTEQAAGTITTPLEPIKDVVMEPTKPKDDDEKFTSPYSALTAPDATPDSLTQIDPSKLPGVSVDKFSTKDATQAAPEQQTPSPELSAPDEGTDSAMRTMDVLLGRRRVGSPAKKPEEFQQMGAITSEAQALSALGMSAVSGEALLGQGQEMPPPKPGDGKPIYEAFRRFA